MPYIVSKHISHLTTLVNSVKHSIVLKPVTSAQVTDPADWGLEVFKLHRCVICGARCKSIGGNVCKPGACRLDGVASHASPRLQSFVNQYVTVLLSNCDSFSHQSTNLVPSIEKAAPEVLREEGAWNQLRLSPRKARPASLMSLLDLDAVMRQKLARWAPRTGETLREALVLFETSSGSTQGFPRSPQTT